MCCCPFEGNWRAVAEPPGTETISPSGILTHKVGMLSILFHLVFKSHLTTPHSPLHYIPFLSCHYCTP